MNKSQEKASLDLQRLMQAANLKTKEDFERFASQMVGKTIPSFEPTALTAEEQAQDLVYKASEEEDVFIADNLVFNALQLDPTCVEAYEYLGDQSDSPLQSMMFYKNGFEIAERKLGKAFFKKNKAHFWLIHETRPYMRCMKNYAECLYLLNRKELALETYFFLLELNPNDNQGVRDYAGLYSLELGQIERYEALHKTYNDDVAAFHYFNYALFRFIQLGDCQESRTALAEAREANNFVLQLMLSKKELPELAGIYGFGDKNEAVFYCTFAKEVWKAKPGAIAWLEAVYNKR